VSALCGRDYGALRAARGSGSARPGAARRACRSAARGGCSRPDHRGGAALGSPARRCPRCGEKVAGGANRCRYCRAWLDEEDEDEAPARRRRAHFKPCPRCGAVGAERVTWTPWGSFYGPALFTHVRCRECGYGYNGRTGRSNLVPAIFMVAIPLVLIIAIVVGLLYVLDIFGGRR